ncbi:helicase-related protein [Aliarcobacter skirrowii]|uniref:helicase-related protein n=1 Tax=Aliarcobacter skirrowii TaxID=28200 RepID=UPI0029A34AE2|nr:helicase-related protein [Aliarcobacter skirrowii]MDX4028332.1 DEAD/DEAH box helicase family protein [Aliarcobacter skirrowii]
MTTQKLEQLISQNRDIFYKQLKEVIKPSFDLDNPEKYELIINNILTKAERKSFPRQARLVAAATEFIEKQGNKSLLISSEMGTGKTDMGLKISMSEKFKVNVILCPPHLVDKWEDEIKINYADKNSFKVVKPKRWEDLAPYIDKNLKNGVKYYFIISRENAKLGYPKQVSVLQGFKYITKEKVLDGQEILFKEKIKVAKCPTCFAVLEEGMSEDFVNLSAIPYKCECGSILRSVDKTASKNLQTRMSIAEYVKRQWKKGSIDLLIVDEIHEYKGGNTGQGNALAQFASMSKKIVGLTGTLLNGYASSLFYILYRLNPTLMKKTLGYDYNQVKDFVETYGAHEAIVEAKEVSVEGVVTKMGKSINLKEKPKVSPYLLSVLLDMTIFLRLDEIKMENQSLPDYEESIELVEMDEELKKPYMAYLGEISSRIRKDKRFLGNLATDAIAVPDMPFQFHSAQDEIFYEPEFTREDFGYTNKEKRLLEIVKDELAQGRKCLVYVHFSNKGVGSDITEMLSNELPQYKSQFLSPTIQAVKRQAYIRNNPCDVLICNPELVKTGLDLLEFPTIIFYETTYNVFTLKQASRRSWRIGQKDNVKVIFMAYQDTPQHKALELIGAKVASANSLEGRLSGDDDLSSMGDEDDNIQLALAKAILKGESSSKDIQMSATIKNFGNDREYDKFEIWYKNQMDIIKTPIVEKVVEEVIETKKNKTKKVAKVDTLSILDEENIEDTTTVSTFFYYSKKGTKVEVESKNIFDFIPKDEIKNGMVQLSLF